MSINNQIRVVLAWLDALVMVSCPHGKLGKLCVVQSSSLVARTLVIFLFPCTWMGIIPPLRDHNIYPYVGKANAMLS